MYVSLQKGLSFKLKCKNCAIKIVLIKYLVKFIYLSIYLLNLKKKQFKLDFFISRTTPGTLAIFVIKPL